MVRGNPADRLIWSRNGAIVWGGAGIALLPVTATVFFSLLFLGKPLLQSLLASAGLLVLLAAVFCAYLVRLYQWNRILWRELLPDARRHRAGWYAFGALLFPLSLATSLLLAYRQRSWLEDSPLRRNLTLLSAWLGLGLLLLPCFQRQISFLLPWFFLFAFNRLFTLWSLSTNGLLYLHQLGISAAPEAGWRRVTRKLLLSGEGILLAGTFGVWIAFTLHAERADKHSLLALRQQEIPLTPAELRSRYPYPEENGNTLWHELLRDWPFQRDSDDAFSRLFPLAVPSETPLPPEAGPLLAQLRQERRKTGELLDRLPAYPACDFQRQWEQGADMPLTGLSELRRLGVLQRFRVAEALAMGDRRRIRELWRQSEILADWAFQDGPVISSVVGLALAILEMQTYEPVFGRLQFTDSELAEFGENLYRRELRLTSSLQKVIASEAVIVEVVLQQLQQGKAIESLGYPTFLYAYLPEFPLAPLFLRSRTLLRHRLARLLELACRPFFAMKPELEQLLTIRPCPENVLTLQLLSHGTRYYEAVHECIASWRCIRTALAAERYRRKYGHWPQQLEKLVPEFLPEVPQDPFDGNPLRHIAGELTYQRTIYRSSGEEGQQVFETVYAPAKRSGFRVYSIGSDQTDQGGQPKHQRQPYDIVYSFYDPI